MKKLLAVFAALLASVSYASADTHTDGSMSSYYDPYANFYLGGDLGFNKKSYDSSSIDSVAEDNLPMLNVYAGYNFTNNYAVEVGAFVTKEESKNSTDTKEAGMFVDAVGKYHVYDNLSLLGTVGLQYSKLKVSNSTGKFNEKEYAPRLGLGAEYDVYDKMKLRGMVRYVFSDYDNAVSNSMHYTLGLNYKF